MPAGSGPCAIGAHIVNLSLGSESRPTRLNTGADVTHPDLDDRDFRRWSGLVNPPKVVDARNFVGGGCVPLAGATDGHGHGTHVPPIATGTGE